MLNQPIGGAGGVLVTKHWRTGVHRCTTQHFEGKDMACRIDFTQGTKKNSQKKHLVAFAFMVLY